MKIQSTVHAEPTNELIELPKSEQLRVRLLMAKLLERATNIAIDKDSDEITDFSKLVTDELITLFESEYSDLLFYQYKLEKHNEFLKKNAK